MRQSDVPLPKPPDGDRPSENWVCGNAKYGTPCPCGPMPNGACSAIIGQSDGSDLTTPKPCTPVRSSLGRRRLLVRVATLAGLGILMVAIGGNWRREIFAPGPLIEPHALLLSGENRNDRCAACHPAARGNFAQWFGSGVAGHVNVKQSDLCMDCHHAKIDRGRATMPHNLHQSELRAIFESLQASAMQVRTVSFSLSTTAADIECAVCHREHHGRQADLKNTSNEQCQACHSVQFKSFSVGHPQWKDWPYGRGGSIAFNHSSHMHNHFTKDGLAFDCRSCHQVNARGDIDRSGSFDSMCASCHKQPLELKTTDGFSLVGLPTLDSDAIEQSQMQLGPWPEAATGVDRFEIPELTRALLSKDPAVAKAIAHLTDPKLNSLTEPLSPDSIKASVILADALRRLLTGLATNPVAEVQTRLGIEQAGQALGQLSPQLTANAQQAWFVDNVSGPRIDPQQMLPNGGWYRDDLRSAIRYRGIGHADPLLKVLAEISTDARLPENQRGLLAAIASVQACLECHPTPSMHDPGSWRSVRSDANKRLFTKFSHRPHMNLPQLSDCGHCHAVNQPAAINSGSGLVGDFKQLSKSACVECHVPAAAGDGCTKCHNYHVDPLPSETLTRSTDGVVRF